MKLLIGNKNYSSWSMRPWVLLTHFDIPFEEVMARFDSFAPDSTFKATVAALSPAGKVPILVEDDGFSVWDTLAIAEYVAEKHPDKALWPRDAKLRARARSVCAEMHSGFGALRSCFGMNIEASLPEVGARVLAENPGARADLGRMVELWQAALAGSGGPFLFGDYSIADAYFAPVATRMRTYALPVPDDVAAYLERAVAAKGTAAWIREALEERNSCSSRRPTGRRATEYLLTQGRDAATFAWLFEGRRRMFLRYIGRTCPISVFPRSRRSLSPSSRCCPAAPSSRKPAPMRRPRRPRRRHLPLRTPRRCRR